MNPTRPWKVIATLVAIVLVSFALGFIAGTETKQVEMNRRFDPAHWNVYAMNTLRKKLDLTPAQEERIQGVIDRAVAEMKVVHQDTIKRTARIVDQMLADVGRELTPDQRRIAETLSPSADEVTIDLLKVGPEKK